MKSFLRAVLLLLVLAVLALVCIKRNQILQPFLEKWINRTQSIHFDNSLKIEGFHLNPDLRVSIDKIHGTWQTKEGGFPFEIVGVAMTDPVTNFIFKKPVHITFQQFRPKASTHPGLTGKITLLNDKAETFELQTALNGLYLEELTAFNPDMLKDTTGNMIGSFYMKGQKSGEQELKLRVGIAPPGGRVQSRFFEVFVPYLPIGDKETLAKIRLVQTVGYRLANVAAELENKNALKVLLNIQIPEYNLNLNLNLLLRVEDSGAFIQLTQLLGLAKVENV